MKKDVQRSEPIRASLTFGSERFDPEIFGDVSRQAKLEQICLVDQKFRANLSDYFRELEAGKAETYRFRGKLTTFSFDRDSGTIGGGYSWAASVRVGKKAPISLTVEYFLLYSGLEGADPEYVALFFNKIARFASYPYFRSVFATCVANAGVVAPPLPALSERVD